MTISEIPEPMPPDPDLQARLLELIFGLLPEDEENELRAQIAKDAHLAEALAEVQAKVHLMGEAAKLAAPTIVLSRPESGTHSRGAVPEAPRSQSVPELAPWSRWAQWAIVLAASLLVAVSLLGWARSRSRLADAGGGQLRLQLTGPSQIQVSASNRYSVTTTTAGGRPAPANVHFALYTPGGARILGHTEKTGPNGTLQIDIPADLELPDEVRLTVSAGEQRTLQTMESRIPVGRESFSTYLHLDRLHYVPGDVVRYRSVTLSRSRREPCRDLPLEFGILGPRGTAMKGSRHESVTRHGAAAGEFAVPADAPGGVYALVASGTDSSITGARCEFTVKDPVPPEFRMELEFAGVGYGPGRDVAAALRVMRPDGTAVLGAKVEWAFKVGEETTSQDAATTDRRGGATIRFGLPEELGPRQPTLVVTVSDGTARETLVEPVPLDQGKVAVDFYPEGGDLAAVGENRVYFAAHDKQGEPVDLTGWIVDEQGNYVVKVASVHQGRGVFRFSPRVGTRYRLLVESPQDAQVEGPLPYVSPSQKIVINTGSGVFGPGKPVEFNVRASQQGLPLVAMASCRGIHVGERAFRTKTLQNRNGKAAANAVAIPVPDSVGGVIRLTVFDYSVSPPRPIAERLVFRRPLQRLDVSLIPDRKTYSPGDSCRLGLHVVDENGRAVESLLGLSVIGQRALGSVGTRSPTMAGHFWLASEVERPQDLEDADFFMENKPEAEVALDLLLGTQGWRRFAERSIEELRSADADSEQLGRLVAMGAGTTPPLMLDNLASLKTSSRAEQAPAGDSSGRAGGALAALIVLGGAGLLVLVSMMSLLRIASGVRIWAPAVTAVGSSFFLVVLMMTPDRSADRSVAFVSYRPTEIGKLTEGPVESENARVAPDNALAQHKHESSGHIPADLPVEAETQPQERDQSQPLRELRSPNAKPAEARQEEAQPASAAAKTPEPESEPAKAAEAGDMTRQPGKGEREDTEPISGPSSGKKLVVRQYRLEPDGREHHAREKYNRTVLWQPFSETDARGRAQATFDLSDSATEYRVIADAIGDKRIGSIVQTVICERPFRLAPRLPAEMTIGDRLDVPVTVSSGSLRGKDVRVAAIVGDEIQFIDSTERVVTLDTNGQGRCSFSIETAKPTNQSVLRFRGEAGPYADSVEESLRIEAPGYPDAQVVSGVLKNEQPLTLEIPQDVVDDSIRATLTVFPSLVAELQMGLQSIDGNQFDSALATIAVADLLVDYLKEHEIADPERLRAAKDRRSDALRRLSSFRDSEAEGGYSPIDGRPAEVAATADVLLTLSVDRNLSGVGPLQFDRTAEWLMDHFHHQQGTVYEEATTPDSPTGAMALWALAMSGRTDLDSMLELTAAKAVEGEDPEHLALAALVAAQLERHAVAGDLLDHLVKLQADNGCAGEPSESDIAATALAIMAWLTQSSSFTAPASKGADWLMSKRDDEGGFGSPRATALALRALVNWSKYDRRHVPACEVAVRKGTEIVGRQEIEEDALQIVVVGDLESAFHVGANTLKLQLTKEGHLPYMLTVRYSRRERPAPPDTCPLELNIHLDEPKTAEGKTVRVHVRLKNTGERTAMWPVLHIGLPAGLEVAASLLDTEKKAGRFLAYGTQPRRLILFWQAIKPGEEIHWAFQASATIPGRCLGPASFAYLRQHPRERCWAEPLSVEIVPEK